MKKFAWNVEKADALLHHSLRGNVTFEDCVVALETGKILDVVPNPSSNHRDQSMFVLEIGSYAYCVPFVETETEVFLKTVFPSRKFTALYLRDPNHGKSQNTK